ncbi:MAG: MFS transporter [Actinomycetia bacterium]|nr:MFS transporter [Actinomycetes bacterium]MCP4957953.1 MFS transporter [Actinomycetes bacterium]
MADPLAADSPRPRLRGRANPVLVLVLATLTAGLTGPGQTIGVSVFIDHFVDDLSLSRSQVSGAYMVGTLVGATMLPKVGRLVDRRGVRLAQIAIGLAFSLALVNMSLVNGLVWLAVGFTGIRLMGQGSLSMVSTMTVSIRFARRRGTALGIFATVSAGLMALVPVALNAAIGGVGWRWAWVVAAAVVATTVVPIAFFGLRSMPVSSAPTLAPPVRADPSGSADGNEASAGGDYDRSEAMRTRSFWILAAVSSTAGMLSTALNFHQIDLLGDAGLSDAAAAAMFIPQVIGSSVMGLLMGYMLDRFDSRFMPAASMLLLFVAHMLAAVVEPGATVFVYAVVLGAQGGAVRTVASTLLPNWFGTRHLGAIQGSLTLFGVGASALGPVALAVLQEVFGSYPPAIIVLSTIPVAAMVFSLFPDRNRRPL